MIVKLLTEQLLEFLSLKGGYTGSSESTLIKMRHCWKSHVTAELCLIHLFQAHNITIADPLALYTICHALTQKVGESLALTFHS